MKLLTTLALVAVLVTAAAGTASAAKKLPTTPGKYTEWGEEIDELEVVETFKLGDYDRIVVAQFDGSATALPSEDDNSYAAVKQVLADIATPLVLGIREATTSTPKTLLIRGKVLEMDPGSRAKRYWGGFGAGAAAVQLAGEVVDAASGKVLLRFTQARRSGFGIGGGGYPQLLNRNLRAIGEDVVFILQAF